MSPRNINFNILAAGVILTAGSVYLWGFLGINPDAVGYLLSSLSFPDFFREMKSFFLIGAICLGILLIFGIGYRRQFSELGLNGKIYFGLFLFALTLFPPQWILQGGTGILTSFLGVIQNTAGLTGILLIAFSLSGMFTGFNLTPSLGKYRSEGSVLLLIGGLYTTVIYLISQAVLDSIPHIGDGFCYLWGAKMLAAGHFTLPVPESIEFFFSPFMISQNGVWFTQYPGGMQMLLVPFVLIGVPALLNPLMAGLTLIIFLKCCDELNLSRWWGFLFVLSPFVIFMSGSFMSHSATLFWGSLGLYALLKSNREKAGWLLLWGVSAGLMFSIRPYTALCFNLPLIIFALRRRIGLGVLLAVVGAVLGSLPFFIQNYYTTGSFFITGYQAAWEHSGLFFGESPWGPPHTPQYGVIHFFTLLQGLNARLFEMPLPALIGVILWILLRKNKSWKEKTVFWAGFASFAGYYFYYYVDMAFGPRFTYSSTLPLLLITAIGCKSLYHALRRKGFSVQRLTAAGVIAVILLFGISVLIAIPARTQYFSGRYSDVEGEFLEFIAESKISNAIVFLDDYPSTDRHARLYSLGFNNRQSWQYSLRLSDEAVNGALMLLKIDPAEGFGRIRSLNEIGYALNQFWGNPAFLPPTFEDMTKPYIPLMQGLLTMSPIIADNDIIYARDFAEHNAVLMKEYPGRNYYRADLTEKGYTLVRITIENLEVKD